MSAFFTLAATNAVAVIPLALAAFLFTRLVRSAAVRHTVWVVVLVKFIAPPVFSLPVTVPWPAPDTSVSSASLAQSSATVTFAETPDGDVNAVTAVAPATVAAAPSQPESAAGWLSRTSRKAVRFWQSHPELPAVLLLLWGGGSLLWIGRQAWRAVRFERLLASAPCVPTRLQQQTDALAADLGLKAAPRVFVIDAAVSPMLWGCGRSARLLFPADLVLRLDDEARATLITHELAHYSRGDHLVRVVELLATAAFWWHPVLWWTRSQIEQAEEECCDAWVVRQFPHVPRRYAEALLDTIDFLCEQQRALPPLASGLGQAPFLRRRLTQIMAGPKWQPVPPRMRLAILLAAAAILPVQPFVFATPLLATARPIVATKLPAWESTMASTSLTSPREVLPQPSALKSAPLPSPPPLRPRDTTDRPRRSRAAAVWSTAVSSDGRFTIQVTVARQVVLTDLQQRTSVDLSDQQITAVAFAPDEPWFATAGSDGRVTLWNAITGRVTRSLPPQSHGLRSVAIAPNGRTLAVGAVDGSVTVYDLSSSSVQGSLPRASAAVNCVRYSPSGRQLAVAIGDWSSSGRGRVNVYDLTAGRLTASLPCEAAPGAVAFASDEELIVGLFAGRVQLWNLQTQQVAAEAEADKSVVATAAFSPDNPALREIRFAPVAEAAASESHSPLDLLRAFLMPQP